MKKNKVNNNVEKKEHTDQRNVNPNTVPQNNPPLRRLLMVRAARKQIPLSGTFELTPRCNMNCRMCYIRMSEEEMQTRGREYTAAEWIEMGKICADAGMLFLLLTGGEPFLRPDFRKIYTELKKLGLFLTINTNATLIDEETVAWLKKDPPVRLNITLYGTSNETYGKLCGNPRGYNAAVKAIDLLCEAGILVGINVSLTRYNIQDLPGIIEFAKSRGIKIRVTGYMFPPVRSAKDGVIDEEVRFNTDEFAAARFQTMKYMLSEQEFSAVRESFRKGELDFDFDCDECDRIPGEKMGCMAGRGSFWITWDGRMTPCGMMNEPVARPFEEGFLPSWKKIAEETDDILLPPECKDCKARKICSVCGALAIAEGYGDSTIRPEYLCQSTKRYIELIKECEVTEDK